MLTNSPSTDQVPDAFYAAIGQVREESGAVVEATVEGETVSREEPKKIFISFAQEANQHAQGFKLKTEDGYSSTKGNLELNGEMEGCRVFLALLSPGYFADEACRSQLTQAVEAGLLLVVMELSTEGMSRVLLLHP